MRRRYLLLALACWAAGLLPTGGATADGQLALTVIDEKTKQPIACRMHLVGPNKRPRKADRAPFWHDHFVLPGKITLKLPVGNYTFEIQRGPEYLNRIGNFQINHFADDSNTIELRRFVDLSSEGWWSGDLFVRRPARDAELLMVADDLHVAQFITWWNDKRDSTARPLPTTPVTFDRNRCYSLTAGGISHSGTEMLLFNLPAPLPVEGGDSEYPPAIRHLLAARKTPGVWVDLTAPYWWDLPMLVAHGQVDSIEIANSHFCRETMKADEGDGKPRDRKAFPHAWGHAQWNQEIYFRLLDCGLRIPPSAGSGSGIAPNPAGYNRVYVHLDGDFSYEKWWKAFRAGRVVVTNGPLMRPKVEGELPGHVFRGEQGKELELEIGLTISITDPISYLDIIKNGRVEHSVRFPEYAKTGRLPKVKFKESGWFLLRAATEVQKTYRFALSGPYYVEVGDRRRVSKRAAQFFLDWVYERARQIQLDDAAQRNEVLQYHRRARDFWQALVSRASAE